MNEEKLDFLEALAQIEGGASIQVMQGVDAIFQEEQDRKAFTLEIRSFNEDLMIPIVSKKEPTYRDLEYKYKKGKR